MQVIDFKFQTPFDLESSALFSMFLCCSPTHSLSTLSAYLSILTQAHPDPKRNDTYVPALKDRALYYKLQNQHKVLLKKQVVRPTAYYCRMTIIESFDPNYSQRKKGPSSAQQKKCMFESTPVSLANHKQLRSPINAECVLRHTGHRKQSFNDVTLRSSCASQ